MASRSFAVLAAAACVLAAMPAAALPIVPVASRAALAGDDNLVWAGADGTAAGMSHLQTSAGGLSVTATATDMTLYTQDPGGSVSANFAANDKLLTTFFDNGSITLSFSAPIRGIGFNIAHQNFGAFTGTMEFFNALNSSLGTVNVAGASSNASASFLGGVGNLLEISSVLISVDSVLGGQALAINDLSLVTTPIPEPSAALMLLLGLSGLALHCKRAQRQPD